MGTTILLFIFGVVLIFFNVKAINKEKLSFKSSLHNAEVDMSEFDVRLGEIRREFTETIAELQLEIEELRRELKNDNVDDGEEEEKENRNKLKDKGVRKLKKKNDLVENLEEDNNKIIDNKNENMEIIEKSDDKIQKNNKTNIDNNKSVKINEVSKLLKDGYTADEISQKLGINKGEVLLIKDLYLK